MQLLADIRPVPRGEAPEIWERWLGEATWLATELTGIAAGYGVPAELTLWALGLLGLLFGISARRWTAPTPRSLPCDWKLRGKSGRSRLRAWDCDTCGACAFTANAERPTACHRTDRRQTA